MVADGSNFFEGTIPLPWSNRIKIALGAAKGLAFLHNGPEPVIYRDFKTSNILLDSVCYVPYILLVKNADSFA